MAAPPKKRTGLKILLVVPILGFGGSAFGNIQAEGLTQDAIIQSAVAIGLLIILVKVWTSQQENYDEAITEYEDTRMCQRCGTFYSPR